MSAVEDDPHWIETADHVKAIAGWSCCVAPGEFAALLPAITPYERARRSTKPDILVLHKGRLEELGRTWIAEASEGLRPTFANEVFVVFSASQAMDMSKSVHFKAFLERLNLLPKEKATQKQTRPMIYLGQNRALTKTLDGLKMYVDTRDYSLAPHILLDGEWEPWITEAYKRILRPGMQIVEVGANIGYYSLIAGARIGPEGKLFAFEANPQLCEILFANVDINGMLGRATVVNKAVAAKSGPLRFNVFDKYLGSSSLFANEAAAAHYNDKLDTITVEGISLDEYFRPGSRIDLLKMDAEGAEPHILRGADRLIRENPNMTIVMEFAPSIIRTHTPIDAFLGELARYGFDCQVIAHDSSLRKVAFSELVTYDHCDVVLSRPG